MYERGGEWETRAGGWLGKYDVPGTRKATLGFYKLAHTRSTVEPRAGRVRWRTMSRGCAV